jgi:hypothetical protein
MDKIIVYVDDAEHALQQLTPMLTGGGRTQWIVVACPPRMTRHISKWVSNAARENWRIKWAEKLCDQFVPALRQRGDPVTTQIASGPLNRMTARLLEQSGQVRVLDARRPKFGQDLAPVTADQPTSRRSQWTVPGSVATMGAVLILASE